MSQPLQIQLLSIKEWLDRQTTPIVEPLREEASDLLKEVEERIGDTVQNSQKILENSHSEMSKSNPKTYRFARNANKFAQSITETMKAAAIPENFNYEKLHSFCSDLEKTFFSLEQLRRGAYPYISPYFIFDRRRLDVSLKRLSDIIKELRDFVAIKYEKAKTVENAYSLIQALIQAKNEIKQNREDWRQIEEKETTLGQEISKIEQEIENIQSKVELNELVKLNHTIRTLRGRVKHSLRYLQKPFIKLQRLARTPKVIIPLDEVNKLGDYLNDPFKALATEENGYPTLKSILQRLDSAIAQRKLKLKSTRLRKAQDQIDSVLNKDAFGELQKNCKEALSHRKELITSQAVTALQTQMEELQGNLKELRREKEFVSSKSKALEDEQRKLQERLDSLRKELEKNISQLTDKNVQVILAD